MQHGLNGAQTRALKKLKAATDLEFKKFTACDNRPPKSDMGIFEEVSSQTSLKEINGDDIYSILILISFRSI